MLSGKDSKTLDNFTKDQISPSSPSTPATRAAIIRKGLMHPILMGSEIDLEWTKVEAPL